MPEEKMFWGRATIIITESFYEIEPLLTTILLCTGTPPALKTDDGGYPVNAGNISILGQMFAQCLFYMTQSLVLLPRPFGIGND